MKKIKEIAATCGVSEQAIRGWCRRNQVAKDAKHSFAINETTLSLIYQHYHVSGRNQVSQRAKPSFATGETYDASVLEIVQELKNQLEVKDKQIADLSTALLAAQDTAKAAQALQAASVQQAALESAEQKETRWSRLKNIWRG